MKKGDKKIFGFLVIGLFILLLIGVCSAYTRSGSTGAVSGEGLSVTVSCDSGDVITGSSTSYGSNCGGSCPISCGTCSTGVRSCTKTFSNDICGSDCAYNCAKSGTLSITCSDVACTPQSDEDLCSGKCGYYPIVDRCNNFRNLNCGGCPSGQVCKQSSNTCCTPNSDASYCSGKCGNITVTDNCGNNKIIDCGGCLSGQVCSSSHVCCTPQTDAQFCSSKGITCGHASGIDTCGQSRDVFCSGSCDSGEICNPSSGCFCDYASGMKSCVGGSCISGSISCSSVGEPANENDNCVTTEDCIYDDKNLICCQGRCVRPSVCESSSDDSCIKNSDCPTDEVCCQGKCKESCSCNNNALACSAEQVCCSDGNCVDRCTSVLVSEITGNFISGFAVQEVCPSDPCKKCTLPSDCDTKNCETCVQGRCAKLPGATSCGDVCCQSSEKCCDIDKDVPPVCCSKETTKGLLGESNLKDCAKINTEVDDTPVRLNYCKTNGCTGVKSKLCTSWSNICCLPEEVCREQTEGINTPFCATLLEDNEKCDDGRDPCYKISEVGKDAVLCCKAGETCETTPVGNKKFCNPASCNSGQSLCKGIKDYEWKSLCCEVGQSCYPQGNGYPRCVNNPPKSSGDSGSLISLNHLSLFLNRNASYFTRDGVAYIIKPHGLVFNVSAELIFKNYSFGDSVYIYKNESYFADCNFSSIAFWSEKVGVAGKNISNNEFSLNIPARALSQDVVFEIQKIELTCSGCEEVEDVIRFITITELLENLKKYDSGEITKIVLKELIKDWIEN
ncbi:MAG: hypothetical protein WCX73_03370 [Candidatus Pacearchaeota archaeon]